MNRNRKIIAYHEAGHAVAGMAVRWYAGQCVELAPKGRPELAGKVDFHNRRWEFEQPYQRLEIGVGGFLVSTAGWLAERRLFAIKGWRIEDTGYQPWFYDNDDGTPAWDSFYGHGTALGETDPVAADHWLAKASVALGIALPTLAMRREIEAAAADLVTVCWPGIEPLAKDLDKSGKEEDLARYWEHGSIGVVERLCQKWVRRFARWYPEARRMRVDFD